MLNMTYFVDYANYSPAATASAHASREQKRSIKKNDLWRANDAAEGCTKGLNAADQGTIQKRRQGVVKGLTSFDKRVSQILTFRAD